MTVKFMQVGMCGGALCFSFSQMQATVYLHILILVMMDISVAVILVYSTQSCYKHFVIFLSVYV
jgi:hypothetical protein